MKAIQGIRALVIWSLGEDEETVVIYITVAQAVAQSVQLPVAMGWGKQEFHCLFAMALAWKPGWRLAGALFTALLGK